MLRKTRNTLIMTVGLLLLVEIALQIRSQIRYGQSVFNILSNETTYVFNEELGLKLLRPDHVIDGSQAVMKTNSLGLRDEPVLMPKPTGQYRIAVVGASTIMGTYTRNNQDTLSYRLQQILNETTNSARTFRVINAGIAGYSLNDQRRLVERLLSTLDVDHYVLYTGFNDLGAYCRTNSESSDKADYSLPKLVLPKWLLTTELITKNTVALRTTLAKQETLIDPQSVDETDFRKNMAKLAMSLQATGKPVLVVGNARAFRRDMPYEQQQSLSETARYYNSCFDIAGLHELLDRHNDIIREQSVAHGLRYFNLQQQLPGGSEWFGDATHFSIKGSQRAAAIIAQYLRADLEPPMAVRGE